MGLAFYKIHILRGTTTRQKAERANGFKSAKYFPFLLRYNSNMWPCDNGIGIVIAITFPMVSPCLFDFDIYVEYLSEFQYNLIYFVERDKI